MTDEKPEIRNVEGGVVSAHAYPHDGTPDLQAENARLWAANRALEIRAQELANENARLREESPVTNPQTPHAIANGRETRSTGVPRDERPPEANPAPLNSPWRGYVLCRHCRSALTLEERDSGSAMCEPCELAGVPR